MLTFRQEHDKFKFGIYRVPHNYLNQKLKIQPAICPKSLVNYEISDNTGSNIFKVRNEE